MSRQIPLTYLLYYVYVPCQGDSGTCVYFIKGFITTMTTEHNALLQPQPGLTGKTRFEPVVK